MYAAGSPALPVKRGAMSAKGSEKRKPSRLVCHTLHLLPVMLPSLAEQERMKPIDSSSRDRSAEQHRVIYCVGQRYACTFKHMELIKWPMCYLGIDQTRGSCRKNRPPVPSNIVRRIQSVAQCFLSGCAGVENCLSSAPFTISRITWSRDRVKCYLLLGLIISAQ